MRIFRKTAAKADPMAAILRLRAHLNPDGAGDDIDWERLEWWAVPARRAAGKAAGNDLYPQENAVPAWDNGPDAMASGT